MRIGATFTFEASHLLPKHQGKCKNHHGHSYKLEVQFDGEVVQEENSTIDGMVVDFGDVKDMVKSLIIDNLDHRHLNDIMYNPTAEHLARDIFMKLEFATVGKGPKLVKVKLWEKSVMEELYVECRYEDIQHILQHKWGDKLPWAR